MADKTNVNEWVESPAIDNDNIGGISLQENVMRPPAVNNAFREMMAQLRAFFKSNLFRLRDNADETKLAAFDLSNIPTATTRTYNLPAASGILALKSEIGVPSIAISASVSANALTISLKGADGNDPSASNPVNIAFRNPALATGTPVNLPVTAASSLLISSGSTMGFANATAGRLWVVGFNDAGTFRLGAVNVRSGSDIMPLRDGINSATAEGGAGAADSAQVIYAGATVSSKAMTILGYMDWSAGLATAGTWAIVPTTIQLFGIAIPLPGEVIQSKRTSVSQLASGNTTVPLDDTIPQINEGFEFITVAISPYAASNLVNATAKGYYAFDVDNAFVAQSIFRDATANALATSGTFMPFNGSACEILTDVSVLAATGSSTTFRVRTGAQIAGNIQINGSNGSRRYGGALNSFIEVKEIMA